MQVSFMVLKLQREMGLLAGFDGWKKQNIRQLLMRPENVKSSPVSGKDTNIHEPWYWDPDVDPKEKADARKYGQNVRSLSVFAVDPKYFDYAEVKRQVDVWKVQNYSHPWKYAPAKVMVKTKNSLCHLKIEYTLGFPPQGVQEFLTNPRNLSVSPLLENKSTKVLKKDGPRQVTEVDKALRWKLFGWTLAIPIHLIIDENHQTLTTKYKKRKMRYMKVFEGSWKVEPLYVDQKRLCKSTSQISEKEYIKCTGGQGRIASKVTMEHIFQPCSLLNVPPVSWFIREFTIKTTKSVLEELRKYVINLNKIPDLE